MNIKGQEYSCPYFQSGQRKDYGKRKDTKQNPHKKQKSII